MEFPIRFPAPFLNNSPLPCIRSGPSPYISIFPAPYLNYSPSPYNTSGNVPFNTTSTDPSPSSSYTDASRSKAPFDPVPRTHSSFSDPSNGHVSHASKDLALSTKSIISDTSIGQASYTGRYIASSTKSSYEDTRNGHASYAGRDLASITKSSIADTSNGHVSYADRDLASSSRSTYIDPSNGHASDAISDSASSGNFSYTSSSSSYASDLAMDTSQELSTEDEEYIDDDGKELIINDSGISGCDDSHPDPSPGNQIRGSRKRKSFEPCRTLLQDDPDFRGVTVTMENKLVDSEWMFVVHSTFSLPPKKKRVFRPYVDSSEEEDINNNLTPITEEKHCASCSVKKTPLWRDAEDGTPLCNACGIRYKKYKLRCGTCWHIPKKDEFRPTCQYCGSFYEYIYPRR